MAKKDKLNRKTGIDLRKDYNSAITNLRSIEGKIIERCNDLVKKFPDIEFTSAADESTFTPKSYWESTKPSIDMALYLIQKIEKYNEENSGIVQKEINF